MASPDRSLATSYSVDFPLGGNEAMTVPSVEIRQSHGSHDLAIVTVPVRLANADKTFTTGAPVDIRWSNRWGRNRFVGYVHHTRSHYGTDKFSTKIVCVAASFPLVSVRQRTFVDTTADHVVRMIADEHGLGAVTEPHPRIYGSISQATVSDWSLLCRLARETGYVLRADQTTLQFASRSEYERQGLPLAQTFQMTAGLLGNLSQMTSVFSFDPVLGEYIPEAGIDGTRKAVRVVGADGATLLLEGNTVSGSGFFTRPVDDVANSIQDASARLEATLEANRFIHRARVSMVGSPSIAPEKPVFFTGLPSPYNGYWTVLSAVHRIKHSGSYLMELEVGAERLTNTRTKPGDSLSNDARDSIVARDASQYETLRVQDSDSRLEVIPGDIDGVVGTAFSRAAWKSTRFVEV